ncbi:MAG: type II and III secretion system protein [Candidatus Cloacimonetes bacterium]|nr:type II and III secretion system protein [Candidatus Cloacimonadota bacterium]MDD4560105.1 type II and III secretion system protein [Candidatus Cloacimonadota bacterium]
MNKIMIATSCLTLIFGGWLFAQNTAQYIQEKVSMSEMTHINNAVRILENFSEEEEGKKLINLSSYNGNINVPIQNMQWRQALELIALQNKLVLEEGVGYLAFRDTKESVIAAANALEELDPETKQLVEDALTKQVRIKAVAMLADRSYLKNLGIDWSSVFNGKVTVKAGFAGASQLSSPLTLSGSGTADVGDYSVDINTLIRTIESNQKGSILAEPSILVSSGKTGRIQVGQDISIKTADEAGNTLDSFFSTGIIMDVSPLVVDVNGEDLIMMKLSIERSSGQPSEISTVITKSTSSTELIMYDNEETVIAGLFDTDEVVTRSGIPILKDLPWWFLGIRYLTGYNSVERKERELIITIKAEIVDSALDRLLESRAMDAEVQP